MSERIEVKADFSVTDEGVVEGIAWPFGTPDRVGDEILPGAFKTITGPIPMLAFHEQKDTVGVWDSIAETAQGLVVKGRLLVADVARAREVLALIKAKALPALSIGFKTRKSAPRRGGGRTISALDLLEISIVAIGMHPGAVITSAKGLTPGKESHVDEQNQDAPDITALETKIGEVAEAVKGFPAIIGRLDKIEAKVNRPAASDDKKSEPSEERKAFNAYLRHGKDAGADTLKTLTVSSDPQGGYLAPTEMSTEMIRDITQYSPIRGLASVRTTTQPSVTYPKRTGITNALWKGEQQALGASEPAFGQTEVPIREVNTYVDVSNQLLADSGGMAEAEVRLALAEDFGQKEGDAFVNGTGVLDPEGILVNSAVSYTATGNASTLGTTPADKLIDLYYSVKAAYRTRGTWLMNGSTLAAIRKLKDSTTNIYLWQPSLAAGQPETILGRPVIEDPEMPDVGSAAEPIVFGDISAAYRIVDRIGLSILVNPYLLATNGVTRIHATRRVGGKVVQPAAIRKLRCATS